MPLPSRLAGVVALVLVAALAGCTPAAAPEPTPTITAEPRPTPDVVVPAVALPVMPLSAFGGDCSVVATDAEVSAATGGAVTATPYSGDDMPDWVVQSLGGIRCAWGPADANGVWVTVIPVAAAGQDVVDEASDGEPSCYGGYVDAGYQDACSFSTTVGDWWYAGVVYTAPDSDVEASDAIDELVADFATRSTAHPATVPTALDRTWTATPDCDALDEAVDTTSIGIDLDAVAGNQPEEAGPGFYGAVTAIGEQTCYWEDADGAQAQTGILPGGWWALEREALRPGAAAVSVPGTTRSVLVPEPDGSTSATVYVTDGVNLVAARGTLDPGQLGALAVLVMEGVTG